MSDATMPIWAAVVLAVMLFAFGVFVGYAIAAFGDLRRIERNLAEIEARQGWGERE